MELFAGIVTSCGSTTTISSPTGSYIKLIQGLNSRSTVILTSSLNGLYRVKLMTSIVFSNATTSIRAGCTITSFSFNSSSRSFEASTNPAPCVNGSRSRSSAVEIIISLTTSALLTPRLSTILFKIPYSPSNCNTSVA